MSESSFVTLNIYHASLEKTFQINSYIQPATLHKLLLSVFPTLELHPPSKFYFRSLDSDITSLDFNSFCEQLPFFHRHSFELLFKEQDHVEQRLFSSPQGVQIKPSQYNHSRYSSLVNGTSGIKSPVRENIDRVYFCLLDQMLDEEKLEAKEFFFLKCLFFEQRNFVMDFILEELRDQDYDKFSQIMRNILNIKGFGRNRRDSGILKKQNMIDEIVDQNFGTSDITILRELIDLNDNNVLAAISVFNQEGDEEELIDTLIRIVSKRKELIKRRSFNDNGYNPVKLNQARITEESYEDSTKSMEKSKDMEFSKNSQESKSKTNMELSKKSQEEMKQNSNKRIHESKKNDEKLSKNIDQEEMPEIANKRKGSQRNDEKLNDNVENISNTTNPKTQNAKESMIAVIFKTLLEETDEEFEAYEIGFAKHLFQISDAVLIHILNTAETIELAVQTIKARIESFFMEFLKQNFNAEEIKYIQVNKCERSNEICSLFCSFKEKGVLSELLSELLSVFEAKKNETLRSENNNNVGKFSSVVVLRSREKKSSFQLLLMKEPAQQHTVNVLNSQNQLPMIVTINQTENQALKDLLHNFHQRQDIGNDKDIKNQKLFDEIMSKISYDKETCFKLKGFMERNHFGILKVLNFYEKFNGNMKKVKGEIDKLLKRESLKEIDDMPCSPCLRNKIYKFNGFKQTIHELMDRYQLISPKQQKLFLYLYLSEDLALLGAFEAFMLTNSLQDFVENLRIIDKFHFFKTNLDFDEIEQFDENVEFQLSMLFAFKKYLKQEQKTALEKIIRAGDQSLIDLYHKYRLTQEKTEFLDGFLALAEEKTIEMKKLEQKMFESRMNGDKITKNLDSLDTFRLSKFLKNVKYYDLVEDLVKSDDKLIQTAFEIYEMTKDKADFIENIQLIYNLEYKKRFKSMILETRFMGRKLKNEELHFLNDCIELDIPNILAPYEIYMAHIHGNEEEGVEEKARKELVETIEIALRVYKKEIALLEKTFYK